MFATSDSLRTEYGTAVLAWRKRRLVVFEGVPDRVIFIVLM